MLVQAVLTGVEHQLNRVLSLDSTALPKLAGLQRKTIEIQCSSPAFQLYLLPNDDGLRLLVEQQPLPDCSLKASATSLLRLILSQDKAAVLHGPDVDLSGDSAIIIQLAEILQGLELDWEYQLSLWFGPVVSHLIGANLRTTAHWTSRSLDRVRESLADYLSEESRALAGKREANACFNELDQLKLGVDRLEARIQRLISQDQSTP